ALLMPTTAPPAPPEPPTTERTLTLPVSGMTCASCVRRVARAPSRGPGVESAPVNLATAQATVTLGPEPPSLDELRAAVEKAGYTLGEPTAPPTPVAAPAVAAQAEQAEQADPREIARQREIESLKRKSLVSLAIGVVMMALMYVDIGVSMATLAPFLLIAATFVQVWAGGVFYRAAWAAARHGGTNMNTLVAVGTSAAYGYSA